MKKGKFSLILLCFLCFCVSPVFGFSTHSTTISRAFDKEVAVVGESITVTVSFANEEAYDLRGFYYTEQVPEGLSVNTDSVKIDGNDISYVVESGSSGDVFPGSIPYRWVLEIPTDFVENNPISENSFVEIAYTVTSSQAGSFNFDEFNWVGYYQTAPEGERAAFGHSEDGDKQTITASSSGDPGSSGGSGGGGGCFISTSAPGLAMIDLESSKHGVRVSETNGREKYFFTSHRDTKGTEKK